MVYTRCCEKEVLCIRQIHRIIRALQHVRGMSSAFRLCPEFTIENTYPQDAPTLNLSKHIHLHLRLCITNDYYSVYCTWNERFLLLLQFDHRLQQTALASRRRTRNSIGGRQRGFPQPAARQRKQRSTSKTSPVSHRVLDTCRSWILSVASLTQSLHIHRT